MVQQGPDRVGFIHYAQQLRKVVVQHAFQLVEVLFYHYIPVIPIKEQN